ncbi:MAG TPA: DNA repair protein RadA [Firmicutes bacterium]|nr:DNA repair protein RadA [Bacillota bacterium]
MTSGKTLFICRECGYEAYKWMGRCPSCRGWQTFQEERVLKKAPRGAFSLEGGGELQLLGEIVPLEKERFLTGIGEFDRVLGGGAVAGSTILVGGDPGIGKSTLLLQVALRLADSGNKVIYVTGEESLQQVKMRAARLCPGRKGPLLVLAETEYKAIEKQILQKMPHLVILDSIQTIMKSELGTVPGSVVQVREVTASLVQMAKGCQFTFFIVGHVTKEGTIAGPRLLEHMVDCVLYLEGERYQNFRILRGIKNRFGSTNEIGIFTMESRGLTEVDNPSALFLEQRPRDTAGSVVVPFMEGTRPLLVEIQALVTPSYYGGNPRRVFTGLDYNRVALIIAVLEKRLGLQLYNGDIFANAVGGVKVTEPAADLGVALSISSSFRDRPVLPNTLAIGEIGLTGEVRPVSRLEERLREGIKMGFRRCLVPNGNLSSSFEDNIGDLGGNIEISGVSTVAEALDLVLG